MGYDVIRGLQTTPPILRLLGGLFQASMLIPPNTCIIYNTYRFSLYALESHVINLPSCRERHLCVRRNGLVI